MAKFNHKIGVIFLITAILSIVASNKIDIDCSTFSSMMGTIKRRVEIQQKFHSVLEKNGYVTPHSVFGVRSKDKCIDAQVKHAIINSFGATVFKDDFNISVNEFQSIACDCSDSLEPPDQCIVELKRTTKVHQKYRSIDGRGNNLKNPHWGASSTPFSRFALKNYENGIHSIKKSSDGSDLPNARLLVQEVLAKAVRTPPPHAALNVIALLLILFATHDLHYQVPVQPNDADKEILCCSKNRHHIADKILSHSACLPIEVSRDDSFYKNGNIGCLNMVRSRIGESPDKIQPGEILNQATSFMDLSLIYGNHESELNELRLYKDGKLRMGKNNMLPVDANGNYIKSMDRFVAVPMASIWPALFARNHNHLAERLATLNPHWEDEILFQEARRINIANLQFILIGSKAIESVFGRRINESYSDARNAGTFVEFALTYRAAHYYIPSDMVFLNEDYKEMKRLHISDTIGKIELLENDFDDALRGAANQPINLGPYSDEIINRIGKNKTGYGIDLIATDIQRGRDHGMPSFAAIRRKCKLSPVINSFDDLHLIMNETNVNLLKKIYKSYEDVDLYVGGLLETFTHLANPLAGATFGCIIGENYANAMGGDIYYFSHAENPYPMTKEQIAAINKYPVSNLFCTNSGLKDTNKMWPLPPFQLNRKIDCKNFPPIDLAPWKEVIDKASSIKYVTRKSKFLKPFPPSRTKENPIITIDSNTPPNPLLPSKLYG